MRPYRYQIFSRECDNIRFVIFNVFQIFLFTQYILTYVLLQDVWTDRITMQIKNVLWYISVLIYSKAMIAQPIFINNFSIIYQRVWKRYLNGINSVLKRSILYIRFQILVCLPKCNSTKNTKELGVNLSISINHILALIWKIDLQQQHRTSQTCCAVYYICNIIVVVIYHCNNNVWTLLYKKNHLVRKWK